MDNCGVCKLNFPLYCCECLGDEHFVVAGGGGAAKTGVRNCVEIVQLCKDKKRVVAHPIDELPTGEHAIMTMAVALDNQTPFEKFKLAIGMDDSCHVYSAAKCLPSNKSNLDTKQNSGLSRRRPGSAKDRKNETSKLETRDYLLPHFKFELEHKFEMPMGTTQTCVMLSKSSKLLVVGTSGGHVKAWKLPSKEKAFVVHGHKDDVTDIDVSPDETQVASVSREGTAYLWDVKTGHKTVELHSMWNMQVVSRAFRFRNCRFNKWRDEEKSGSRPTLFTTHVPLKRDASGKSRDCFITKWQRPISPDDADGDQLRPAIIRGTGNDVISSFAVSRDGIFVAVGFMEGAVAIYVSFSLQCARRLPSAHSIFVTSLSFLDDSCEKVRAITGSCDATVVSVSADCACHVTALSARPMFSFGFILLICLIVVIATALGLHLAELM